MSIAVIDGLELYYEDSGGEGVPLVLLHGGVLTIELSFDALRPRLGGRTIAVELQGHGRTADVPDREFSVPRMAQDVLGLLDHLGVLQADVLGFSLGGMAAAELAVRAPGRVRRLVLASVHFRPDGYHDEIRDPAQYATSTRMPTADDFAAMRREYERIAPHPDYFETFMARTGQAAQGWQGWSPEELGAITARTLVVIGDHDFVRIEHAAEMQELIPDAVLGVLPGTTHNLVTQRVEMLLPMLAALGVGALAPA